MPFTPTDVVFVESKVGSREGQDQLRRYAEHLSAVPDVRHRSLVYITRDYDPKDEDEIVGGLQGSYAPVGFVAFRWHGFYRALQDYRSTSMPSSDLIQEVLSFMKQHGMSQTNRLSAADVVALTGMSRMLAYMRETLSGEVEAKLSEVSGTKLTRRGHIFRELMENDRYFSHAVMASEFWCGAGFSIGQDDPDDYPWLSVILEVGTKQSGRGEITSAMRSFAADCSGCEPYDLDDSAAWSGLEWSIDLREVLTAEDHMAAARTHFLKSLDDVARMREQYPHLPWGSDI
jgi:hypothetical protein